MHSLLGWYLFIIANFKCNLHLNVFVAEMIMDQSETGLQLSESLP